MTDRARVVALPSSDAQRPHQSVLGGPIRDEIKRIVIEALKEVGVEIGVGSNAAPELLTPEQLAERLQVPLSWIYEQSRQRKIPTHRLGRYIRFDLREVIESQKNKPSPS